MENVVKTAPDAIVAGNASADIVFDNVKSIGPILTMWRWSRSVQGTQLYATVHNITVTNCVFDGESRMDFNFFDPDGKGTLTLRGNQAHRPVKVRAPGGIRISGDTPFEKK
jgi:polygalacturonase